MSKNSKSNKSKTSVSVIIFRVLALVALVVFLFAGWKLYGVWSEGHQLEKETEELAQYLTPGQQIEDQTTETNHIDYFSVDWAGLKAANPNVVAWVIVPGTGISYPVVQGADNDYYLTHTYTGAYNSWGSIFLDAAANPNFLDDNSLIYGHSVSDVGGMFTSLKNFSDQSFFDSHPYFWLLTPEQNYRCNVIAFYQGSDDAAVYLTDYAGQQDQVMADVYSQALYTRDMDLTNRNFVTLSTCNLDYGFSSNQRIVLMGALQEWNELIPQSEAS
ncbi:class B sortase [Erysipelotrichaceae bacterium 51-3]|uniref:class B sortase n=1 Tax=Allobaculum sp. JKK-2023 TaxID=3108943 RepID=UPI002B05AE8D|nr:class B sortase [Allobaculum sp. JKK-2023]